MTWLALTFRTCFSQGSQLTSIPSTLATDNWPHLPSTKATSSKHQGNVTLVAEKETRTETTDKS